MISRVQIKIFGTWYDAIMEKRTGDADGYAIRKYILMKPLDLHILVALMQKMFTEVECDDGHKSEVYVSSKDVLIEKDFHKEV